MAINLQKGQKIDLTKGNPGLSKIVVGLGWDTNRYSTGDDFDLDATAFLLAENHKVTNNKDFIYYGYLKHSSGGLEHLGDNLTGGSGGDDEQIKVNLDVIPSTIERIAFAVTISDADKRKQNFGQVNNAYVRIVDELTNNELVRFDLGEDFSTETAVVVGELYRYKGEWKFNAIGSGFKGGLRALCINYGVDMEIKDPNRGAIILNKGQKINLSKTGSTLGEILVNLNWSQPERTRFYVPENIDLDLGCLYELTNGKKGCVQALGNAFGNLNNEPFISLDGDDRTGESADGENLRINGIKALQIKRILIYTFIYEGAADWKTAKGRVTVKSSGARDIIVNMDEYGSSKTMCAIALIENKDGNGFSIEKLVQFYNGHRDMDQAFNWGLHWVHGTK